MVLPRVRDDIAEFKRLNVHLYQALKKCLFKPQVFFKAILIPLCEVCVVVVGTWIWSAPATAASADVHPHACLGLIDDRVALHRPLLKVLTHWFIPPVYAVVVLAERSHRDWLGAGQDQRSHAALGRSAAPPR